VAAVTVGPSVDWYLTRASGSVALVLLSASVVIGIAAIARLRAPGVPRFVVDGVHRTASLLAVSFLAVHIVTAVLDSFASISLLDAVIPFVGSYRPLWLGLGAVAFDLLLAVAITSLVRHRMEHGTWRGVHWLAYAAWPVAVVHGLGTGSDVHQTWLQAITVACILTVLAAVTVRAMIGWPGHLRLRIGALAMSAAFAGGLALWLPGGPLGKGWARRAGTPSSLLSHAAQRRRET
jgi:methionine sulfoxide reductase heme-binding subunit